MEKYSFLKPLTSVSIQVGADIPTFLGTLFQYRDKFHLAHLNTTSYAQHVALNDLYEGILDQIDTLVETAQAEGLLSISIPQSSTSDSNVGSVKELLDYVRMNRNIFMYSYQQQILDNIEELLSRTIYKLTYLK